MHAPPARIAVCPLALALLGACGSASEPAPSAVASTPAKTDPAADAPNNVEPVEPPPAKPEPATPEPATPEPPKPEPTPTNVAPAPPTLRTVAVREGVITMDRQGDAPLLVLDGEPVAWTGDAFVRHPTGGKGLWRPPLPEDQVSLTLAAVSLPEPLGAWTSSEHEIPRIASYYEVYQRKGDQWRQRTERKDLLVAYTTAFVERDGALLALRGWAADVTQDPSLLDESEEPDAKARAREAKRSRALARAKQAWVRVAGNEAVVCPEIPAHTHVYGGATTTADGTILALASASPPGSEEERRVVLMWKPGQATAERIELPGLGEVQGLGIGSSGEWVLLAGSTYHDRIESYLAVGRGSTLERVPVSLPGRSDDSQLPQHVSGAARWPDGELWISIADPYLGQEGSMGAGGGDIVWRKPVEGPWQPVALPKLGGALALAPHHATALLWAAGAVWITIGAGPGYEDHGDTPTHAAVLTTLPGTAPPLVLPSEEALRRERTGSPTSKPAP